jgi:hypothetical protein
MSSAIKKIATATAVTLVAGLGLTGSAGSATAATGGFCEGQSAPANTDPSNQAPVPVNDTANVVAGTITTLKVLANDTDPDGDKLYLENATSPRRGEVCVNRNGTIDFYAEGSRNNYTTTFTYGVTDGDRYRTATVTVNVESLKPVRPVLKQRLVLKHGHVKQPARMTFTNNNKYRVILLAGNPKKSRPAVQRVIYPGRTFTYSTKQRRLAYVGILAPKSGEFSLINQGILNTRNGHIRGQFYGGAGGFRSAESARTTQEFWAHR